MPFVSCLFGVASPLVLEALNRDPTCAGRVHRLAECEGIDLAGQTLAVVFLQGSISPPWPERDQPCWDLPQAGLLPPPVTQYGWLDGALPPPEVVQAWVALSRRIGRPLVWWWWWERGDELYADAAWVLGPGRQAIAARETPNCSGAQEDDGILVEEGAEPVKLEEAPLQFALAQLGFESTLQYFAPADDWKFDWSKHLVC